MRISRGRKYRKKICAFRAGLFPEEFFIYFHEADLAARLLKKGYKIKICSSILSFSFSASPKLSLSKLAVLHGMLYGTSGETIIKIYCFPIVFHLFYYLICFTKKDILLNFVKAFYVRLKSSPRFSEAGIVRSWGIFVKER